MYSLGVQGSVEGVTVELQGASPVNQIQRKCIGFKILPLWTVWQQVLMLYLGKVISIALAVAEHGRLTILQEQSIEANFPQLKVVQLLIIPEKCCPT
jgi:hypothetical protein